MQFDGFIRVLIRAEQSRAEHDDTASVYKAKAKANAKAKAKEKEGKRQRGGEDERGWTARQVKQYSNPIWVSPNR